MAQLTEYCARILSRPLDRDRPLWEIYVIEGLEEGRFAVPQQVPPRHDRRPRRHGHRDRDARPRPGRPPRTSRDRRPWSPASPPPSRRLGGRCGQGSRDLAASSSFGPPARGRCPGQDRAAGPRRRTGGAVDRAREPGEAGAAVAAQPGRRAQHRRLAVQRMPLDEVKDIKDAFGTTVNDVVLAAVADATGRYLRSQGTRTTGLWLRAMVPVVHAGRLRRVTRSGTGWSPCSSTCRCSRWIRSSGCASVTTRWPRSKSSHHAVGAGFLIGLAQFAPPTIHAMASRSASAQPAVQLPGDQRARTAATDLLPRRPAARVLPVHAAGGDPVLRGRA